MYVSNAYVSGCSSYVIYFLESLEVKFTRVWVDPTVGAMLGREVVRDESRRSRSNFHPQMTTRKLPSCSPCGLGDVRFVQ